MAEAKKPPQGSASSKADTMALISSKLSNIVPFSCCALFLNNEESETLRCRFATGVEADLIQQMTIKSGHGLTDGDTGRRANFVRGKKGISLPYAFDETPAMGGQIGMRFRRRRAVKQELLSRRDVVAEHMVRYYPLARGASRRNDEINRGFDRL